MTRELSTFVSACYLSTVNFSCPADQYYPPRTAAQLVSIRNPWLLPLNVQGSTKGRQRPLPWLVECYHIQANSSTHDIRRSCRSSESGLLWPRSLFTRLSTSTADHCHGKI
ncbi:hypothetical protein V2G26_016278 [Clonostachys chloroleuca]